MRSLLTGTALGGVLGGLAVGFAAMAWPQQETPEPEDPRTLTYQQIELFAEIFARAQRDYVVPIDEKAAMSAAINGMLMSLDPHSGYLDPEDFQSLQVQTSGEYGGLGLEVTMEDGFVKVISPMDGTPAAEAGIQPGDFITAINKKPIIGRTLNDAVKEMRGERGSEIEITVLREGSDPFDVKLVRDVIQQKSVTWRLEAGDIAYIRIASFTERTNLLLEEAIEGLSKGRKPLGILLDLRNNGGGLLDEAVNMCNLFMNGSQLVVSTKGKNAEWDKEYKTTGSPWDEKIPVVVLINRNSASASEIVAGTLQDLDRGVVIGQRSFGKGLVQTTRNLVYNAKLKVTTAKYYTPSGRCIQMLDYSHRNEDGSVGHIPDSIKTKFKTKNGRTVMDGGGVDPDIKIESKEALKVIAALNAKSFIFDYATQYVKTHPTVAPASSFQLSETDFNAFVSWLDGKDYSYETKAEELLTKFKEVSEKENYFAAIKGDYENLRKALAADKKQDLMKHRKEVTMALQEEIISRYYFQKGRIENLLQSDPELAAATEVLGDQAKYTQILSGK